MDEDPMFMFECARSGRKRVFVIVLLAEKSEPEIGTLRGILISVVAFGLPLVKIFLVFLEVRSMGWKSPKASELGIFRGRPLGMA